MDPETKKILKSSMIWHHKWIGIGLILWGIWHYLCHAGLVSEELYWPVILIVIGIMMLIEVKLWKKF